MVNQRPELTSLEGLQHLRGSYFQQEQAATDLPTILACRGAVQAIDGLINLCYPPFIQQIETPPDQE